MDRFTNTERRVAQITDIDVRFSDALRWFLVTLWAYFIATLIIALTIGLPILAIFAFVKASK